MCFWRESWNTTRKNFCLLRHRTTAFDTIKIHSNFGHMVLYDTERSIFCVHK
jgi:hypothetical protein